jgi:hypothetical protein
MTDEHNQEHHPEHNPAVEAVEHLQAAAVEVIKATRAFLDLAEHLIGDPTPLLDLVGGLAAKGRSAAATPAEHPAHDDGPKVQHIRIS